MARIRIPVNEIFAAISCRPAPNSDHFMNPAIRDRALVSIIKLDIALPVT